MSQGAPPRLKIRSNDFSRFRFRDRGPERLKSSLHIPIFMGEITYARHPNPPGPPA